MASKKADASTEVVEIQPIILNTMTFRLLGLTPLIMHKQSQKMKRELLLPSRKNKAALQQTEKHNPYEEFRASAYISSMRGDKSYLHFPGGAFKRAISECAVDIPGAAKAQIGRLVSINSTSIDIYGLPYLHFMMARLGGQNKTPDPRFRCALKEWACEITLNFVASILTPASLANLVSAAGVIRGVGDGRVEKGALDFGQFRIVADDDEHWHRIVAEQGFEAQKGMIESPVAYDEEAEEMLDFYDAESARRKSVPAIAIKTKVKEGA